MNHPKSTLYAVINPVAGSSNSEAIETALKERLGNRLLGVHLTREKEDFASIAKKALDSGANVIMAAGGDGTISQLATHLVGKKATLLVLPAGTANLLAKCLGIPHEIEGALDLIDQGRETQLDAIEVNGKYYFSHLSVGIYSKIAQNTPSDTKRRIGRLAYIFSGLKLLFQKKNWKFHLDLDGRSISTKASTLMVANVGDIGAASMNWGPNVSPADGKLDICLIKSRNWKDYLRLAAEFLYYKDHAPSQTSHFTVKERLGVKTQKPLPIRGDGEVIGETPLTLNFVSQALRILVPQDA